jgi:signal transduction histidine kinase
MAGRSDPAGRPTGSSPGPVRRRPLRSVRARITFTAAVVTAVALAVGGWLLVRSVEEAQLSAAEEDLALLLDRIAGRLAAGAPPEESVRPGELTTNLVEIAYADGSSVDVVPTAGGDEVGVVPGPRRAPGAPPEPPSGPVAARRAVDTPDGEVTVTATAPVDREVARSVEAVERALAVGLPLLVGLVTLVAWWTAGRALRPVERIRAEADAIGAATLHRRVPEPGSGDEVHRLSRTMNAMLDRLEGAVTRQRQFVADASHELRNPVAAMRIDLEAALCEGDRADWPEVARTVLAGEARVEGLLGDLLVLAAEDEGAALLPRTDVDLRQLAVAEATRRRDRGVPVSSTAEAERVLVAGSRSQLERALANLVDNAERHAASQVCVGVTAEAGRAELWVDDDGPGIAPADRERVFERFTRLDDSRARDQGGTGLGLAVVRSIVARHRGSVWVEDSALGGARFVVALPVADPPSAG